MQKTGIWHTQRGLPIILTSAVLQGWSLYGLHHAIQFDHWPANSPPALLALYALAIFVPLTIQFLAQYAHERSTWILTAAVGIAFFYFGWHTGAAVMDADSERFVSSGRWFPLAFVLAVLWLMLLPFLQARVIEGHWRTRYELLFSSAWNNKLVLAEAALFTVLFWLLLVLWAQLFEMLGIGFFEELFEEPIFIYPVTSLVFGAALHLIGSIERLTSVVLQQILSVLKWLALLAGLILVLFTIALVLKLPTMIASGERAIGAEWLLGLVAVTVLLINAAYRDGSVEQPYPRVIGMLLRFAVPLTVIISLTALYALYLRVDSYGFTVERVWGFVVAAAACVYSVGYAVACRKKSPWLSGIARINVIAAWFLIAVISLALTPILSPHRIAANSQFELAKLERIEQPTQRYDTPMRYLKNHAGRYGIKRLEALANLQDHPRAAEIRADAAAVLKEERWAAAPLPSQAIDRLAQMVVYPSDREIDAKLKARLQSDLADPKLAYTFQANGPLAAAFVELDGNDGEEFVVLAGGNGTVYQLQEKGWQRVARFSSPNPSDNNELATRLKEGKLTTEASSWKELRIGNTVYRHSGDPH
jgi:hypothetical protein